MRRGVTLLEVMVAAGLGLLVLGLTFGYIVPSFKAANRFRVRSELHQSAQVVLAKISQVFGPFKEIPVLMHLISSSFDSNKLIDDYLDLQTWRSSYRYLARIVRILEENKHIVLSVLPNEDMMDSTDDVEEGKKAEEDEAAKKAGKSNLLRVTGSLESFITRLDADYTRSLQQINPHTQVSFVKHC